MLMPGSLIKENNCNNIADFKRYLHIITDFNLIYTDEQSDLFINDFKFKFSEKSTNDLINFPPVFKQDSCFLTQNQVDILA